METQMPELTNLVYDTGALIAAERGERRMWALHAEALHRGVLPSVPAGVLAQAWRGGPQPQLSRPSSGPSPRRPAASKKEP